MPGNSREAIEKAERNPKPLRFLSWLYYFVLYWNFNTQFDKHDKEERRYGVKELDDHTSAVYCNKWSDSLDFKDYQTTERDLHKCKSTGVAKLHETFLGKSPFAKHKNTSQKKKVHSQSIRWRRITESIASKEYVTCKILP